MFLVFSTTIERHFTAVNDSIQLMRLGTIRYTQLYDAVCASFVRVSGNINNQNVMNSMILPCCISLAFTRFTLKTTFNLSVLLLFASHISEKKIQIFLIKKQHNKSITIFNFRIFQVYERKF